MYSLIQLLDAGAIIKLNCISCRSFLSSGGNPINGLFGNLTKALSDIASNGPSFSAGPFGDIDSILNKFDLDFSFAAPLLTELNQYVEMFMADLLSMDQEQAGLIRFRPRSFAKYPAMLQLGSKKASQVYCPELKGVLWDKLVDKFPDPTFNGVRIPGLSIGQTFLQTFPDRGMFPIEDFLPHIAIAFGKSWSFSENSALDFTLDELLAPDYGLDVTLKIMDALKATPTLSSFFARFSGTSIYTNMPMDPVTYEIFNVKNYLPEVQVSFNLVPSPLLASPNFGLTDLHEFLSPKVPSLRAFADKMKSKLVAIIAEKLNGLFNTTVSSPGFGSIQIGGSASFPPSLSWPIGSTNVFTPQMRFDKVQGFLFDLEIGVSDSGSLRLVASLSMNFVGVNPIQTLADIASGISSKLTSLSGDFEGLTSSMQSGFNDAATLLSDIADSDRIELLLDANVAVIIGLSLPSFDFSAELEALDASLSASIGKVHFHGIIVVSILLLTLFQHDDQYLDLPANEFNINLGGTTLSINPSLLLHLEANNTRLPIDLKNNLSDITEFDFAGTFQSDVNVGVAGIPVELSISADSKDITNASSVDFKIGLDIDLFPIRETLIELLEELRDIRYPSVIQQSSPYLPRLDLSCVSKSGIAYLGGYAMNVTVLSAENPSSQPSHSSVSTKYPISGFLSAVADGCSTNGLGLSGGYNSTSEELGTRTTIVSAIFSIFHHSQIITYFHILLSAINISVEISASRDLQAALNSLASIFGGSLYLDASFFNGLLSKVELGGYMIIDLTVGAKISQSSISNGGGYGSVDVFLRVNNFIATASLSASSLNVDFPLNLPAGGLSTVDTLILELTEGSFDLNVKLNLAKPLNITDLIGGGGFDNFEYGGSLDSLFPVQLTVDSGLVPRFELGFTLMVSDDDIFTRPPPIIAYELDICPLVNTLKAAVTGLTEDIVGIISNATNSISSTGLYIDHERLTKPLVEYVNMTLGNFSDIFVGKLDINCAADGRFLKESNFSLASTINTAFDNLNNLLQSIGITIDATVQPYFDSTEFAVGVTTELSVGFELVRHHL